MLRYLFVAVLLTISGSLFSQSIIQGTVTDESGDALPGANVYFQKSLQGTITSLDGSFVMVKKEQSPDSLIIKFLGYQSQTLTVDSVEVQEFNIFMQPKSYLADEVLFYGSRAGSTTPVAYTNMSSEELQRVNTGNDITYMLSVTPSVVATSEAGIGLGYTAMRIRGSDPTRINVTVNGIPLNDSESQSVFWVNMPDFSSSVDNVQIQRGVGTSTQGAAAFGATVNFQTGDLNEDPYGEYQFLAGSFNTMRHTLQAGSGLIADHFTIDARVSKLNTDGYIDYSGSDHHSVYLTGAYHASKSLVRFTLLHGNEKTGISWWGVPAEIIDTSRTHNPAGVYYNEEGNEHYYENQTDNYKQTHYQLHFAHSLTKEIKLNAAAHYTRGAGYYEQYQDDANEYHTTAFSDYGLDPVISAPDTFLVTDLARQKWLDNDFFGLTASANYRKSNYELTAGIGWNKYLGDHFGEIIWMERMGELSSGYQWYFNEGKKSDWNLFAKANYILDHQITFFGDLQFRHIKYTMEGIDDDMLELDQEHKYNFLNPKAGVFYKYNSNHKGWASVAIAHREPTRTNFKEAKGDPDATPQRERLFDIELGYKYSLDNLVVGANLYNMRYRDQLIPTGEKSNVGYDIMTNVAKSYRRGIEIELVYLPFEFLRLNANLTLSSNKIKDYVEYATHYSNWNDAILWYEQEAAIATPLGKTHIAYSPSVIGTSIIDYEFYPDAHVSLTSKLVGRQYFDNSSSRDRSIDPYFLNDLKLEYEFSYKFLKQVSLMFQINNLFNVKYINNGYGGNWYEDGEELTWAYYYPQAGFHVFTGVKIGF